jgi:hypothetical protein
VIPAAADSKLAKFRSGPSLDLVISCAVHVRGSDHFCDRETSDRHAHTPRKCDALALLVLVYRDPRKVAVVVQTTEREDQTHPGDLARVQEAHVAQVHVYESKASTAALAAHDFGQGEAGRDAADEGGAHRTRGECGHTTRISAVSQ